MTHDPWQTHAVDTAELGRDRCLSREWLLTNAQGGFAMGTLAGCNTRRYHGLLIAATTPPVGRILALSQTLEQLQIPELVGTNGSSRTTLRTLEFATCQFRSLDTGQPVFSPNGIDHLVRFEKGLSVVWEYHIGHAAGSAEGIRFTRELTLHHNASAITLRYRINGLQHTPEGAALRIRPMVALRDFHHLLREHESPTLDLQIAQNELSIAADDHLHLTLRTDQAPFQPDPTWWHNVRYPLEAERGQDDREDLFVPGAFEANLPPAEDHDLTLTASLSTDPNTPAAEPQSANPHQRGLVAIAEKLPIPEQADPDRQLRHTLAIAAADFTVRRESQGRQLTTLIAGYPWFADWGRDTFIALPGLLLTTGRLTEARDTLAAFAQHRANGLIPNRFDDRDGSLAHYNTADASLWFIHAALEYAERSADTESLTTWLADACLDIIDHHVRGTSPPEHTSDQPLIALDEDGLINAGDPNTQLTWMDAAAEGTVFTPRPGKCVEINALWASVNARLAQVLANAHPDAADRCRHLAEHAHRSFTKTFWNERTQALFDHIHTNADGKTHRDPTLRPNQLLAISLPNAPLDPKHSQAVVETVTDKLLTPFGLRTLPTDHPNHHPRYTGSPYDRDKAYHQGTIWPWLIGPYAEALLRAHDFSSPARARALAAITPLLDHLRHTGTGQLPEIFESADPHRPVGCPAQAWSVAELLRILELIHRHDQ
ncbi:amylo-alpha-1,6-glucosidase [Mucisphaera sp.]|uniref:amylo-alpha-1,6-glucosidase n=1 Tax=Mucisphaera sp. TaxID=2913024 RepID=UPI003D0BDF41